MQINGLKYNQEVITIFSFKKLLLLLFFDKSYLYCTYVSSYFLSYCHVLFETLNYLPQ